MIRLSKRQIIFLHDQLTEETGGMSGIKEAITAAFPTTEQQRCIVHMVRNTPPIVKTHNTLFDSVQLATGILR